MENNTLEMPFVSIVIPVFTNWTNLKSVYKHWKDELTR